MAVTKAPQSSPPVDQLAAIALNDPHPANTSLLHHVNNVTHALHTTWGYPTMIQHFYMRTTHATKHMTFQIPPSVVYVNVGLLVSGEGKAVFTPAAGGQTTELLWGGPSADTFGHAFWVWGNGIMDDAAAADTAKALKVAVSTDWGLIPFSSMTVNPANTGGGSPSGTIWAVALDPIWQSIAV